MESQRFDALARMLGAPLSRMGFIGTMAGGVAGSLFRIRTVGAQANEEASLVCHDGHTRWVDADELPTYLDDGGTEGPCCLQTKVCRPDQIVRATQSGRCRCACPEDQLACDGVCVDVASDLANCGACGAVCSDGEICDSGSCVFVEDSVCGPARCDRVFAFVLDEETCYATGGYLVEVDSEPVTDWCCFCRDAGDGVCDEVAPKAVYAPDDPNGEGPVQAVACLAANDVPVDACAVSCAPIPPREDAPA